MSDDRQPQLASLDGDVLSEISTASFVRMAADASADELERVFAKPDLRRPLLDEIFRRMQAHVRADRVEDLDVVVRLRLTGGEGEGGYDRYHLELSHGACRVTRDSDAAPRATITLSPATLVQLITGQGSPPGLFVTGKLRVSGDLGFAAGLIGHFDLPTP
jgi:putative sterol carrier protein